jgi:hypothetical protein
MDDATTMILGTLGKRAAGELTVGWIVRVDAAGHLYVDWAGTGNGAQIARSLLKEVPIPGAEGRAPEVFLAFEDGAAAKPVVLGLLHDTVHPQSAPDAPSREVLADDARVEITARRELILRCGRSSITLREDGKVILRGAHLLSRASEVNRIQGGTVQIN